MDKIDVINDSYSQLRISGLTVDPGPEELELALNRLEDMAAEWETRNICTGYNFEDTPDPNSTTNIIRGYKYAYSTNLSVRLIADFNKQVPAELMKQATQSLSNLSARTAVVRQVQAPRRQARGSGSTLRYNRWNRFYRPVIEAPISCATNQMDIGDINDFIEHFDAYLDDGEVISSFTISADLGLTIVSSSLTSPDVDYRIEAVGGDAGNNRGGVYVVFIEVTTDAGRVEQRQVQFNLTEVREPT